MSSRRDVLGALITSPFWLSALGCGGEEEEHSGGGGGEEAPSGGGGVGPSGESVSFTLTVGDTLGYDVNQMRCGAGDEVTVTVNHTGSMDATAMGHNFVLLDQGVELPAFGAAATRAADTGYIPAEFESRVIAHTNVVGGGESDSVTFQAPAAGTYKYVCSFPGHFASMQGDFIVS